MVSIFVLNLFLYYIFFQDFLNYKLTSRFLHILTDWLYEKFMTLKLYQVV